MKITALCAACAVCIAGEALDLRHPECVLSFGQKGYCQQTVLPQEHDHRESQPDNIISRQHITGTSSASGYSGYSGVVGASGYIGISGYSGSSGTIGA